MTVLHLDYRPTELADVVGQDAAVRALSGLIKRGASRAFLFSGPSGTGKTTLARIAARMLGCEDKDVTEVDGATNTGIDAMRRVQELTQYRPFGKSPWRALIIDECHALSRQAWQSLLKAIEEPLPTVAWFLCTTELSKVPQTIKTRCASIGLRAVGESELRKLFARVVAAEGIKMGAEVRDAVIREAGGSPRQMLVNLALCQDATSRKEASELLRTAQETDAVVDLCKFLMRGGSWPKVAGILDRLADENPDSVRVAVCNYIGGALRRARSDNEAVALLSVIEPFIEPFAAGADRAALMVAVGRALYSGGE